MPIYEFKCLKCNEFIECLVMNKDDEIELKCPACSCEDLERVLSTANYSMSYGTESKPSTKAITKTCGSGTCTTYEIPGPGK